MVKKFQRSSARTCDVKQPCSSSQRTPSSAIEPPKSSSSVSDEPASATLRSVSALPARIVKSGRLPKRDCCKTAIPALRTLASCNANGGARTPLVPVPSLPTSVTLRSATSNDEKT